MNGLQVTDEVVYQTILLRKNHKIKVADAIIAATAITRDLTLITRNAKDFKKINGLKLKNFHQV